NDLLDRQMPLEKSASYWADLVHADHPHKPLPANTGQQKGTLTKRQRGSRLDAKNTPQGVIIASEFTASAISSGPRPGQGRTLPVRGCRILPGCTATSLFVRD